MNDQNSSDPRAAGVTPPASTDFQPAEPLKTAGVEFDADRGVSGGGGSGSGLGANSSGSEGSSAGTSGGSAGGTDDAKSQTSASQTVKDGAQKLSQQAGEKARGFAEQGKDKATGALDQLSRMLTDAADQVDDKLGNQYGQYARSAADTVTGYADTVRNKDVDALLEDARALVRKSPAVAVGVAAAVGFVLARLVSAGVENRDGADA